MSHAGLLNVFFIFFLIRSASTAPNQALGVGSAAVARGGAALTKKKSLQHHIYQQRNKNHSMHAV